uniref:Ig-like domain-containing protein n=1 Tax=Hippocampus comes TaxID=109280 RepID=A0A3Q2YBJ0_HIPCM
FESGKLCCSVFWCLNPNLIFTVHQPKVDVHTVEGETVTLDCSYVTSVSNDYIFWYKQEANAAPEFILSRFKIGQGKTAGKYSDRYSCSMDASARQAPLRIERVKPSDSGVFYCALHYSENSSLYNPLY